jgi:hypothetical protein
MDTEKIFEIQYLQCYGNNLYKNNNCGVYSLNSYEIPKIYSHLLLFLAAQCSNGCTIALFSAFAVQC